MPKCQPHLEEGDTGFLKCNAMPEQNQQDYRMMLRIIGVPDYISLEGLPPYEEDQSADVVLECHETVSEAVSQTPATPEDDAENDKSCYSQDSFGKSSQISEVQPPKCKQSTQKEEPKPMPKKKSVKNPAQEKPSFDKGWGQPTPEGMKKLFHTCFENAEAIKTIAKTNIDANAHAEPTK